MTKIDNHTWFGAVILGSLSCFVLFYGLVLLQPKIARQETQRVVISLSHWELPQSQDTRKKILPPTTKKPKVKKISPPPPKLVKPKKQVKPKAPAKTHRVAPVFKPVTQAKVPPAPPPPVTPIEQPNIDATPAPSPQEPKLPTPVPLYKLTQLPRFAHQVQPQYPEVMRALGKQAEVTLEIFIDELGSVRNVEILHSGGEFFDVAAVQAMQASTFIPAQVAGRPVAVIYKKKIRFKLQ